MYDAAISSWDFMQLCFVRSSNVKPAEIKIIDFGSACMENRTVYSYIQVYTLYSLLKVGFYDNSYC